MNKKTIVYQKYKNHWIYSDGYKWAISEKKNQENKTELIKFPKINNVYKNNKVIIFKITNNCNLSCKYCYSLKNYKKIKKNNIYNFCKYLDNTLEPVTVIFHGGESLLEYDNIKFIINNVVKKNVIYNIQTNGVLLNEDKINFFIKNNVNICISIDGPKDFAPTFKEGIKHFIKNI
jgi:sulfatase maturation enzyme AslB (radical SAM superfamily)